MHTNPKCPHCGGALPSTPTTTTSATTPLRCSWRKARGGITSWCALPEGHDGAHDIRSDRGPE